MQFSVRDLARSSESQKQLSWHIMPVYVLVSGRFDESKGRSKEGGDHEHEQ